MSEDIKIPYELPEGWKWCRLGDVADYINGRAFKPEEWETEGKPIIRIQNLTNSSDTTNYSTQDFETKYLVKSGDLLFAWSASLGAYIWNREDGWLNQHIFKVVPNSNIDKMYLYYALIQVTEHLYSKTHGSGMVHVTLKPFLNTMIPLPPTLEEQQRIVNRIETLFAKLDEAKEKAQNVVDTFETRKASILHKAFTGELTKKWRKENSVGDDSWEEKKLEEICETIKIGPFGSSLHEEDYTDSGIPVINPKHIKDYQIIPSTYISTIKATELCFYQLKANDIILGRRGEMGRCAPITPREENWICGTGSIIVRLKKEYSAYIYSMLISSQKSIVFLNENAVGSTLKNLNEKVVKQLPVVDISFPEQTEIVRILDIILEKETKAKEAAEAVLEQIDLLKKSILARAFRGEI